MREDTIAPFNALLVEGIPGIGKSSLIDALVRRHVNSARARQLRTVVHLCQAHTIGPLAAAEVAGTLTRDDNFNHLEHVVSFVEWLYDSVRDHSRASCFVLIDTLHLTHCLRPGVLAWQDVADFDRRLAATGCRLLVLEAAAEIVWERSIKARADWPFLTEYAVKFGRTHEELQEYWLGEQRQFGEMCGQSAMRTLLMSNDGAVEGIIDEVYKFWRSGDGSSRSTIN
jgi:hypothetical protein